MVSISTDRRVREAAALLLLPLVIYILVCLLSYHPTDPGWSHASHSGEIQNIGGVIGAWVADMAFYFFGITAYLFPLIFFVIGWHLLKDKSAVTRPTNNTHLRLLGVVTLITTSSALAYAQFSSGDSILPANTGGLFGQMLGRILQSGFGHLGSILLLFALWLGAITLSTGLSWFRVMDAIGAITLWLIKKTLQNYQLFLGWKKDRAIRAEREELRVTQIEKQTKREPIKIKQKTEPLEKSERATRELQMPLFQALPEGSLPPLSLLDEPKQQIKGYSAETLAALSRQVELKLKDFRIDAQVAGVYPGPVVTRFEMEPAPGIRGSQISNLDKDIARGLSVVSVRVVDVIPGKNVIGIEIPNSSRETVYLSEILRSKEYDKSASPLSLALGKDIGGRPVVVDLAKMPHLLVAGTTGSGKSVALNAMVLSLLYKASAQDVRVIMIDPKMLELSVYEGIPHLLAPVVTDMKEAANALRWCVAEMERRYKLMASVGVRNLAGFNRKVKEAQEAGHPMRDPLFVSREDEPNQTAKTLSTLPYLVVLIDEFADMMMVVGKKVEELIARLAQKARAAGIHLILATQRPSVDVITGLIKANIPTRIAFQVSSKIDSRTILDQSGAETLLGHGDMLYLPPGTATPERVHGAFVSDDEVHRVVQHLKQQCGKPEYVEAVLSDVQTLDNGMVVGATGLPEDALSTSAELDQLYDQAVRIVTETRRASISGVQRRLKIGYNRAARLIEEMQSAGIVSAPERNGDRTVLAPPPPQD